MKNLIYTFALLIAFSSYSQKKYGEYTSSRGVYKLSSAVVTEKGKSQGSVYLNLNEDGKTAMNFKNEESRLEFLEFVNNSYIKFKDWKATAIENNVIDMMKDIDEGMFGDNISFYYASWKFNFGKNKVSAVMSINKEGKVLYYLYVPKVAASDNEYMESDSQILIMNDDDIASLNNILSSKVIEDFIKKENSADDLFN
tara:strand:- start:335 stop:928 length:594 start_codon:yes stop_codon:yes gene_type:complete